MPWAARFLGQANILVLPIKSTLSFQCTLEVRSTSLTLLQRSTSVLNFCARPIESICVTRTYFVIISVYTGGQIYILDLAAKVDQCAEFLCKANREHLCDSNILCYHFSIYWRSDLHPWPCCKGRPVCRISVQGQVGRVGIPSALWEGRIAWGNPVDVIPLWQESFLCRLRSIEAHRDHFVRRLSVRPSVHLSVCASVCLSGSHTFLVVSHSYVSQETHAFLGMLPLCLKISGL